MSPATLPHQISSQGGPQSCQSIQSEQLTAHPTPSPTVFTILGLRPSVHPSVRSSRPSLPPCLQLHPLNTVAAPVPENTEENRTKTPAPRTSHAGVRSSLIQKAGRCAGHGVVLGFKPKQGKGSFRGGEEDRACLCCDRQRLFRITWGAGVGSPAV